MSTLILRRRALLAASGAPPSTLGLRELAVIVRLVVCSLFVARFSSLLFAACSGPLEILCPRGILEASLGQCVMGTQKNIM